MKQKSLYILLAGLFFANLLSAQFVVIEETFSATGLSNQGKVAGYAQQAGPYSIWLPDSGTSINIGGLAPGQGIGGQARFSFDGNFICGTSAGPNGAELSKYSRATNQWTRLGSLGFMVDSTVSGGFGISGDGNTVTGLAWADTTGGLAFSHAVAWVQSEGLVDLGTLNAGKSTRANAVSYDGSVVVGWQDFDGLWKSAVWRKKPSGGYYPNQYLLVNTDSSATNEYNQVGECSTVSEDGKWIGGYGDFANNNQPWIWCQDSGLISLGTLPNVGTGYVSGMNEDASIVVGWFDAQLFGDPQTPFIRTRAGGLQELNSYIHTVLGDSTGPHQVYTADCISPDGHYIAGYGVNDTSSTYFTYRVSLRTATGVREVTETPGIKVYPNPTANLITIETPNKTVLTVHSIDGKLMSQTEITGNYVLDISWYAPGVYCFTFQSGNMLQTRKIIKN